MSVNKHGNSSQKTKFNIIVPNFVNSVQCVLKMKTITMIFDCQFRIFHICGEKTNSNVNTKWQKGNLKYMQ